MSLRHAARQFSRSLRGRLVLSAALFILLSMLVVGLVVGKVFERFVRGEVEARLETQISAIVAALAPDRPPPRGERGGPGRPSEGMIRRLAEDRDLNRPPFDRRDAGWYWQIEGRFGPLARSRSLGNAVLSANLGADVERGGRRRHSEAAEAAGLVVRSRTVRSAGEDVRIVATAPEAAVDRPLRDASLAVALPIGLCGLLLIGAIALQVRFGLAPLEALRASLAAVRSGERERVGDVDAAELRPLVAELNALIEQDAAHLAQARRHVANLAHGLKTPLATLSAALERSPALGGRSDLADSIELMDRRIRHHLRRARAAALDGGKRYRTPLASHATDLGSVVERLHGAGRLAVSVDIAEDLLVAVEPEDLDEMLGNLLDNACRHARSAVRVHAHREGRMAAVSVEDDGPGLSEAEIEAVMQPGRRLDETSPGHGFGLPITSELAELHGGRLVLDRSETGGLAARLDLPAAPPATLS